MSVAALLDRLSAAVPSDEVPPVPSPGNRQGTGKPLTDQGGSRGSLGSPAKSDNGDREPDPTRETRRLEVLRMLRARPEITRAVLADGDADPVRVTLAVRNVGTCELVIARDRWDPFLFLELLRQHGGSA